uniref:Uncharacterized protein n=1 Tax=Tanacetum cinerariifolium TaxID=118510 RepID=A0A6L2MV63_TANCI|nr:hypothetical protein [Tanacetum cinerariifolium]
MEIVSAIIDPVVNALTVHITQKLRNLTSSAEHVEHMKNRMQVLEGHRAEIEVHVGDNKVNNRRIPPQVSPWLTKVEDIKKHVDKISSNNVGCFNVIKKYKAGEGALKLTKDIEGLITDCKDIIWSDAQIPLGRVDSKRPASTSTSGGNTQIWFESRDKIFNDALKFLQDDDKTRVIALCGMGGVGKTTLMKQLKEAAKDNKMFSWIVDVGIGKSPNLLAIQKAISAHTGEQITETNERLMATYLSKRFEVFSECKEKSLVILDDVWKESKIKLEDIGLASPLPKGVKLLLTSRDESICREIAVDAGCVLEVVRVDVLKEGEARDLFCRIAEISAENDFDLYQKGCDIVKKCGCLPLAIKLIAATLQGQQNSNVWRRTLDRLKINDLDENVKEIIEISYKSLKQEDKAIFLLCGLFLDDSNIPIEDLTRYAWGLKLLKQVSTLGNARDSTQTSVSNLKNAYLLMDGDSRHTECVKMHDLVHAFVVGTVSKSGEEGCWIVNHNDFSKWSEEVNMSQSCKRISLPCKGMSEFLSEFKFPNLSLLKLMHGNESLRFPLDFYEGMKKLQVIVFENLEYPVVPTSFQCSTNLRTLCLHESSLMFDLTCIGNLLNLEVLSFAYSGITILPSTFGNLKKLRLLDVTGCYNLVIDDGVLKSLVKLEELYMRTFKLKAFCFTDNNCSELAERSENLCALEFEFIGNNGHLKNMSFEKLYRFKLSVGCYYSEVKDDLETDQVDMHSYENSLKLVTNREELLKSKINGLFKITDALYLQVNDMNTLEDVDVESPHPRHPPRNSSFYNLRSLEVTECADLRYLFTLNVATKLSKLEYLEISRCPIMEAVIQIENNGCNIIMLSNLKYLRLAELPKLLSFSNNVNVIELPRLVELQLRGLQSFTSIYSSSASSSLSTNISRVQSFFHEEDLTPKLEKLFVSNMKNLKEIWPPQFSISDLCLLRELTVEGCGSIVVLFSMDFGEIEQLSSSLRSVTVEGCVSLVKLFSCSPFPFLNNLQELKVENCGSIQVLFNTDLGRAGKSEEQVCSSSLRSIKVSGCDSLVTLFPSNPMPLFNHLEELTVRECASIEVIFNIDMRCVGKTDKVSSSRLRSIWLVGLGKLREVWRIKDAGNNLIHGFEAVESIRISRCERFEILITPATTSFDMRALKEVLISNCGRESESKQDQEKVHLESCDGIEEVVSNRDDDASIYSHTSTTNFFPHLGILELKYLRNFKCIGGGANELQLSQASWSLCQYAREISIRDCDALSSVIPWYAVRQMQKLQVLKIINCKSMTEVFETQEFNKSGTDTGKSLPRLENITMLKLPKLKILKIQGCRLLKHILTFSTLESLAELEELEINDCEAMEVIVNKETGDQKVVFPSLKSLALVNLPNFVGFFLGRSEFIWPALEKVVIIECPQITVFTYGQSTAPKLKFISTSLGKHSVECGLNFHVTTTSHQARLPSYESTSSYRPTTMEQLPWSYHNLIEVGMGYNPSGGPETLFSSNKLLQLQKLETVHFRDCRDTKEIFEVFDSQIVAEISNLRQVDLWWLSSLKYIWKSSHWTVIKFPNLTRLSIVGCHSLEYVFTCSMVGSILQLQELHISDCYNMKVIVKGEEECDAIVNAIVVFPCLKSLKLEHLFRLKGFCFGEEALSFPSLDTLEINYCKKMTVFTKGDLSTPKLYAISIWGRKYNIHNRLNSFMNTSQLLHNGLK